MTKEYKLARRNSSTNRANVLNLLMFLTGIALGGAAVCFCDFDELIGMGSSGNTAVFFAGGLSRFHDVFLANGKLLILLYLFAHMRCGALLVPPVFGLEGIFLGGVVAAAAVELGYRGIVLAAIILGFRFFVVLPYAFLLGTWSVEQSLDFGVAFVSDRQPRIAVLLVTLLVLTAASFGECSVAHWLARLYYLKVGV